MLVTLKSVSTVIDTVTKITYPLCTNGLPDLDSGVELSECCEYWFTKLSKKDKDIVDKLI